MGNKKMDGFPSRAEALADFFGAWEPQMGEELVTLDEACRELSAQEREAGRGAVPAVDVQALLEELATEGFCHQEGDFWTV